MKKIAGHKSYFFISTIEMIIPALAKAFKKFWLGQFIEMGLKHLTDKPSDICNATFAKNSGNKHIKVFFLYIYNQ